MANVWVVDSNCFIHIGSMAREGFLDDLNKVLKSSETSLYVTPGVHDEVRTVRFQRWKGQPNLLEKMQSTLVTVSIDEAEVRALARHIGEKASPQDVDLSLMILGSKLAHEGNKVTLVSDDYKMTTTGEKANLNFEDVLLGRQDNNIRIYDGDVIIVKKGEKKNQFNYSRAITSSLNPKFIEVVIAG